MSGTNDTPDAPADRELSQDPERLRQLRIEAGLTCTALAKAAGVSKGSVSLLERAGMSASPLMLWKLSQALGCTVSDLRPDPACTCRRRAPAA